MGNSFKKSRVNMVVRQIIARGIKDRRVIKAMKKIPRHLFVPKVCQYLAYADRLCKKT
ncbi:MAG: protein-L-isoaspartate O-methyltransferase, partial [Spirochaetes bacterium]|nr:protein-L-isoaspartate O-methyltransferase [Spirochaetota bacterium]